MDTEQLRIDLECVTQKRAVAEGETLVDVLERLDGVLADADIPERLSHYLRKRSYLKALQWLDHPEMPHEV